MNDLAEIQRLLKEISEHLQEGGTAGKRQAVAKLERISAMSATMALTLRVRS